LKKRRHNSPTPNQPEDSESAAFHFRPPPSPLTPRRRQLFALLALVLAPLLAFALLEGGLRLSGYGYDTAFFKKTRINGRDFLINNDDFVLRFFPPQLARRPGVLRMDAHKPPDTCRIFILGESAALGDPCPPYGAGRYLQALLSARFPAQRFEVVNVSITAINSHVILPIARACARQQGDIWIIYMGNNEMVGPFGAATVFGPQAPPLWTIRLGLALQKTRLVQWLTSIIRHLEFNSSKNASWGGMEMFLGHQLPPDDLRKERVYRNFQQNLRDILQVGLDSGARVVLNTVAANLKDCSPFASVPPAALPAEASLTLQSLASAAFQAQQQGRCQEAAEEFAQAAKLQPLSADLQYAWASCLWRMTNFAAARQHFQLACDCDALPFRADSRLNDLIRQAARRSANSNLLFLDAAAALATDSPAQICGDETFFEHVHFNFDGNYRLARAWAGMIAPLLPHPARRDSVEPSNWPSQADCEQRLALTDWNRMLTFSEVLRRRQQPPLSSQANNARELESLTNTLSLLRRQANAFAAAQARSLYLDDIQRDPDDYLLRFNFADFLETTGDWKEAATVWKQVQALLPPYYLGYLQEGRMLEHLGQLDQAESALRQTVALYPRMTTAWFELSNIHASEGKYQPALQECQRALSLEPGQPAFYACLGTLLSRMNRPADAIEQLRKAIQIRPDYWDAHLALARQFSLSGRLAEATSEFEQVIRLRPDHIQTHLDLAQLLLQRGLRDQARQQFQDVLRLDPGNQTARQSLASLQKSNSTF
jgi:tetratricopeptide (TPR) repeat protein